MQVERGFRSLRQRFFEPPNVVEVPVTEDNGVQIAEVEAEPSCVVEKGRALPRVEQQPVRTRVEPIGKSVLAEHSVSSCHVFNQKRE